MRPAPFLARAAVAFVLASAVAGATGCGGGDSVAPLGADAGGSDGVAPPPPADGGPAGDVATTPSAWTTLAALPARQQETSVVEVAGKIWVLGGFDGAAQVVATVVVFDPQTGAWSPGPALPEPLHHTNAAVVGGTIYVLGGMRGANFQAVGASYALAPGATQWTPKASLPLGTERGSSFVGAVGTKIYVAGGLRNGSVADAHVYDTTNDTWAPIAPLPQARDHGVSGVVGGVLYAVGGRATGIAAHTPQVLAYDPAQNQWTPRAPMPTSRGGAMAAVVGGKIVVCGGEGNTASPRGVFPQTERFDPAANAWETLAPMKTPRHGTGAASVGNVVYVPGGADKQAFGAVDTVESLAAP
jgi:N-acetylneuraminic acid mutarotase